MKNVFEKSLHRGSQKGLALEYHEFVEALIRLALVRYSGPRVGPVEAMNAFIHNNFRFARGGTNLQVKETKVTDQPKLKRSGMRRRSSALFDRSRRNSNSLHL